MTDILFIGAEERNKRLREWRAKNPDRVREHNRRSYSNNLENIINYRNRRILFKDKRVLLPENPRTGQCSICGCNGETVMHHDMGYTSEDPTYGIIELCRSCHLSKHPEVSKLGGYSQK